MNVTNENSSRAFSDDSAIRSEAVSAHEIPVPQSEVHDALNRIAGKSFTSIALGLGLIFSAIAIFSIFYPLKSGNLGTISYVINGLIFLSLYLVFKKWDIALHWVQPIYFFIIVLCLLHSATTLYIVPEPIQTVDFIMITIGIGFISFSTPLVIFAVLITFFTWLWLISGAPPSDQWIYFGFALFDSIVFSLVMYHIRMRTFRRLETLRIRDNIRNEQLRKAKQTADQLILAKNRFFSNISHEFRTPLTLILGPVEELLAQIHDEKSVKKLQSVHQNARKLLQLINQLLDLSKLEHGKLQMQQKRSDFIVFLKGAVAEFKSLAESKQIKLDFHAVPKSIVCDFDPEVIEKIVTNLLSNALKFTPEGGSVRVQIAASSMQSSARKPITDHCLLITVCDTGIGIAPKHLPHIFDRYYQAHASGTNEYGGTGIGLALVKELIEFYKGKIHVESVESKGTTFTVRLPYEMVELSAISIQPSGISHQLSEVSFQTLAVSGQPSVANTQLPATSIQQPATSSRQRTTSDLDIILVIEDHAELRTYIREHLEPHYKVLEAKDGEQGIELALQHVPDLVISDIMMPKKSGYEVCEFLKENEITCHIPVILLTAKVQTEDKLKGLEIGADEYLAKPFNAEELLVRVKNLIGIRRRLFEHYSKNSALEPRQMAIAAKGREFLDRLKTIVVEHLDDSHFDVEFFARKAALSRSQLHRKLRALTDQSCSEFIMAIRLHCAAELLQKNHLTISEIAYRVGFNDVSYFGKCFKKEFDCTPGKYTKKSLEMPGSVSENSLESVIPPGSKAH